MPKNFVEIHNLHFLQKQADILFYLLYLQVAIVQLNRKWHQLGRVPSPRHQPMASLSLGQAFQEFHDIDLLVVEKSPCFCAATILLRAFLPTNYKDMTEEPDLYHGLDSLKKKKHHKTMTVQKYQALGSSKPETTHTAISKTEILQGVLGTNVLANYT